MYTTPESRAASDAAWGKTLAKSSGSPVLRARKGARDVPAQDSRPVQHAGRGHEPGPDTLPEDDYWEEPAGRSRVSEELSIELMIQWLLQRWIWIVFLTLLGAVAGATFGLIAKPRYTVTTELLVDPSNLKVMADDVFTENGQRDAQLLDVESKLVVLTSGNVLNQVVQRLKLADDPEFVGRNAIGDKVLEAQSALAKSIAAHRQERSFIVSLSVKSESGRKAVAIANTMVSAFQEELVKGQADGAGRAAKELFARLDALKAEVAKADQAVQVFRRENNLQSSSGELVSTLIANQVNTQLVNAQTRVITARSRYEKLSTGSLESRLDTASMQSETMTALRTQYALAKKQFDAQSAILGGRHPKIVAMRPELDALQAQIRQEQTRTMEAAKSELEQAENSLMAQQGQANAMKTTVFEENASLVQLRELEREAQSKSTVYEAFMGRAKQIAERQQIDSTNVRVISPAVVPNQRSYPPRTMLLIAAGMVLGLGAGCALAAGLGLFGMMRRRREEREAV